MQASGSWTILRATAIGGGSFGHWRGKGLSSAGLAALAAVAMWAAMLQGAPAMAGEPLLKTRTTILGQAAGIEYRDAPIDRPRRERSTGLHAIARLTRVSTEISMLTASRPAMKSRTACDRMTEYAPCASRLIRSGATATATPARPDAGRSKRMRVSRRAT